MHKFGLKRLSFGEKHLMSYERRDFLEDKNGIQRKFYEG